MEQNLQLLDVLVTVNGDRRMSCLEKFRQRILELQAEADELEVLRESGKTATKFLSYMIRSDVRCND